MHARHCSNSNVKKVPSSAWKAPRANVLSHIHFMKPHLLVLSIKSLVLQGTRSRDQSRQRDYEQLVLNVL